MKKKLLCALLAMAFVLSVIVFMPSKSEVEAATTTISFDAIDVNDCLYAGPLNQSTSKRIKCQGYWVKQNGQWKLYCTKTSKKIGTRLAYKQYVKDMYIYTGGNWYYIKDDGYMYTCGPHTRSLNNKTYGLFFNTNGKLAINAWGSIHSLKNGKSTLVWYRTNNKGELITGWKQISGKWYYFNTSFDYYGEMLYSTSILYKGKRYYFNKDGACTNP